MNHRTTLHEARLATLAEVLTGARILVVDDDAVLRGLHTAVLNSAGYEMQSAADGEEALAILAAGRFDLVLTDCTMPRLDGIGLVRALRAAGNHIPVMMVSLCDGGDLPADVRSEIAIAFLKPARTRDLLAGIALALHRGAAASGKARVAPARSAAPAKKPSDFLHHQHGTESHR